MQTHDVAIVGAGMAGASLAYELADTCSVVLLESEFQPGYHATGRSAAVYIPAYEFQNRALYHLTLASRDAFDSPADDFHRGGLLKQRDLLLIAPRDELPELEAIFRELRKAFPALEWVDTAYLEQRVPGLSENYTASAILDKDCHDIDVHAIHDSYLRGVKRRGGTVACNSQVTALEFKGDAWHVTAGHDRFVARIVVNAAGAWADNVAKLAGVTPAGIQPMRRTAILVEPPPGTDTANWPLLYEHHDRFYLKSDAGLLLASPADESPSDPCDAQPEELDIAYAAHYLEEALAYEVPRIRQSWAGLRSFAEDRSPVIGFAEDADGFFWMAGQGGHGIQIAPAAARLAASIVRNEPLPDDLRQLGFDPAWVSPKRLARTP